MPVTLVRFSCQLIRILLTLSVFLRATAVPAGTAEARISYGNSVYLSVRLSVTTRWYTKLR